MDATGAGSPVLVLGIEQKRTLASGEKQYLVRHCRHNGTPFRNPEWISVDKLNCPTEIAEYKARCVGLKTTERVFRQIAKDSETKLCAIPYRRTVTAPERFGADDTPPRSPPPRASKKNRTPVHAPPTRLPAGVVKRKRRRSTSVSFRDNNGRMCTLEECSKVNRVLMGVGHGMMRLDKVCVRELLPHLQNFADTGRL